MSGSASRFVVVVVVGLTACAGVVVASLHRAAPRGEHVETALVGHRAMAEVVEATGRIRPRLEVDVSPQVIARVERVLVEEGDEVAEGTVIAELERASLEAARDRHEAQLSIERLRREAAAHRRTTAVTNHSALAKLGRSGTVSDHEVVLARQELRAAELEVRIAERAVEQVEAELRATQDQLARATVLAPIGGTVVTLGARAGETVVPGSNGNPGSVIATISDLTDQDAYVDLEEAHVHEVAVGQRVEVSLEAVRPLLLGGTVRAIATSGTTDGDRRDATFFRVAIRLDAADPRLRPEMSATARIQVARRASALALPIEAVVHRSDETGTGGDVVFVVEHEVARLREVELGIADRSYVEVLRGLADGDAVIVGPYRLLKTLRDGEPVVAAPTGAEAPLEDGRP